MVITVVENMSGNTITLNIEDSALSTYHHQQLHFTSTANFMVNLA